MLKNKSLHNNERFLSLVNLVDKLSDEKKDESSEDSKKAEEEDASAKKEDEEKKEDDKKKYELLESENATLKSQYEELKKEVISLREFKLDSKG